MFTFKKSFGEHKVYDFDQKIASFLDFFKQLYKEENLEKLYLKSEDYQYFKDRLEVGYLNDTETDLHKIFYNEIKSNDKFKNMYCDLIKEIYKHFFPEYEYILYQSFPSVRFQFPKSIAVPPHKDADHLSNHPLGEKNFILPIVGMKNTASLFIEDKPDSKNFQNINLEYGELFYFNGNTCTHYNQKNEENNLRISLDFRILLIDDYVNYLNSERILTTNPRDVQMKRKPTKMIAGHYYQILHKDKMFKWHKNKESIMQSRPHFSKEEAQACYDYMVEDNFITEYKKTEQLEQMICEYLNTKNCIMTTSGTIAILLGLMGLELNEGDEILVPNFTMIATINTIKMLKLKPVIIDIDEYTLTLNLNQIKANITERTKCVMHVSLNNRYKDLNEIKQFCDQNNIYLLEDSAQSLGCKASNKYLGTYGKMGFFSLSTPKIISTGQGGFVVTDDDELAKKLRMIKNFGRKESGNDDFATFGLNFKFTDLQAVVGIEQLKKLKKRTERYKEIYNIYYQKLKNIFEIKEPLSEDWFPWFVDIYVDNRSDYVKYLKKHNISSRPVYDQIISTDMYKSDKILINSKRTCERGLFLPTHSQLTDEQIYYICDVLKLVHHIII